MPGAIVKITTVAKNPTGTQPVGYYCFYFFVFSLLSVKNGLKASF